MALSVKAVELIEEDKTSLIKRVEELEKAVKLETASAKLEALLKVLEEDPKFAEGT